MKKLFTFYVFLVTIASPALAQCDVPATLPYLTDVESATAPFLPDCMGSMYESFASSEIFESTTETVPGFTGTLLAYDTTINTEFGMPANAWVSVHLYTPMLYLEQGTMYHVSFRYGNSDADFTIGSLGIFLNGQQGNIPIDELQNITGAVAGDFVSAAFTPPASGNYYIDFQAASVGTQGKLYLDDISVQSILGTDDSRISGLVIYPNPSKNLVHVSGVSIIDEITLYSSAGQRLFAQIPRSLAATIELGELSSGFYLARVRTGSLVRNVKLIKE